MAKRLLSGAKIFLVTTLANRPANYIASQVSSSLLIAGKVGRNGDKCIDFVQLKAAASTVN